MSTIPAAPTKSNGSFPARPLSPQAQRADKVDNQYFLQKWQELVKPTPTRPAVVTIAEVNDISRRYSTGSGRLDALIEKVRTRLAYWDELNGRPPAAELSVFQRDEAKSFFDFNGTTLAETPAVAPAPAPTPAPKPASVPVEESTKPKSQTPMPALADSHSPVVVIEYLNADGWPMALTLSGPTTEKEIAAAIARGEQAAKILKGRNAIPRAPALALTSSGAVSADIPVCAIHKVPMNKKPRRDGSGSFWSCPQKLNAEQAALLGLEAGAWCKYSPPKK